MRESSNPFEAVAEAMAAAGRRALAEARARDAARPIGQRGLQLGRSDYRRRPDFRVDSRDWAVWLVRWNGSAWERIRRYAAGSSFEDVLESRSRLSAELGLPVVD